MTLIRLHGLTSVSARLACVREASFSRLAVAAHRPRRGALRRDAAVTVAAPHVMRDLCLMPHARPVPHARRSHRWAESAATESNLGIVKSNPDTDNPPTGNGNTRHDM